MAYNLKLDDFNTANSSLTQPDTDLTLIRRTVVATREGTNATEVARRGQKDF
jgi:hypothetical protein